MSEDAATGQKEDAVSNRLTQEDLLELGDRGTTVIIARLALTLSAQDSHKGTKMEIPSDTPKDDVPDMKKKKQAGFYTRLIPKKGIYWKLAEDSKELANIIKLGKTCKPDVKASKNTKAVQEFLNSIMELKASGGTRVRDLSILDKF